MNNDQKEKLQDYLDGINAVSKDVTLPIGAVIVEKNKSELEEFFAQNSVTIISPEQNAFTAIESLSQNLNKKHPAALFLENPIDSKLLNFLTNIYSNLRITESNSSSNSQNGYLILVLDEQQYSGFPQQKLITSVCRL